MPKSILLKAKFRGQQVPGSFRKGLNYNLSFQTFTDSSTYPHEIKVETTAGRPAHNFYKDIYEFFDNWTDIKPR